MTRPLRLAALLFAAGLPCLAAAPASRPPALADLQARLKVALRPVCPEATFAYEDDGTTLAVEYNAQAFQVHTVHKNGAIAPQAHQERGPKYDGFRLRLDFREGPLQSQLALPQDYPGPYWTTFFDAVPWSEGGKPRYVHVALAYGSRTDKTVLKAVKAAVADFAKSKAP